jgi:hypothetical protein
MLTARQQQVAGGSFFQHKTPENQCFCEIASCAAAALIFPQALAL